MPRGEIETLLILAANPRRTTRLQLDQEVRDIQNCFRNSKKHLEIRQYWATRTEDLRRSLLDHRPTYVHFCGHGEGRDGIVLEDNVAAGDALAGLFTLFSDSIRCVVLNACYSSFQAEAIAGHIDYVIGMGRSIRDSAARAFSLAFYDSIGAGESVEFSFALARNALQLEGIPDELTPVLLSRNIKSFISLDADSSLQDLPSSRHDWDSAASVSMLFGRETDADLLRTWILEDNCRMVLLTGLGGIGKTDLAICLGRGGNIAAGTSSTLADGIQHEFECVGWRSLLNAPLPYELFTDLLAILSDHCNPKPAQSCYEQINEIVACLQNRRCLLILDNLEAVLNPGDPSMRYRDGYEPYGSLLEKVGKMAHKSCLLLTSREKPREIAELEGTKKPVRSFLLTGIGPRESQRLFAQIGNFMGSEEDWASIVRLYQGNPLALELVARHVDQVFSGDLASFLNEGRSVFADLRQLLDWHLDRLSSEETEIIYWLAIEREPVSRTTLLDDLLSPISRDHIASTLQSLQRRVPLERVASQCFALQPVLVEHITARLVDQIGFEFAIERPETLKRIAERLVGSMRREIETGEINLLNTYSLVKATSRNNVRESQVRLILQPIVERLLARFADNRRLSSHLIGLLDRWRLENGDTPGYAAGNILNLLAHLRIDLSGFNFSGLRIWQAYLQSVLLYGTDFSQSDFRHTSFRDTFGNVFAACYSPGGEFIAFGDDNGEVRIIRASDGSLCARCSGHSDAISAVTFSNDGALIASASYDQTVRLWRANDGQCLGVLRGHRGWVSSVAFSPDCETLASGSGDGVRIWNCRTMECRYVLPEDKGSASAVAFSPDGNLLAFGGGARSLVVLTVDTFECLAVLRAHTKRIRTLAFSPDGKIIATGADDGVVYLWQLDSDEPVATLVGHSGLVRSLSFGCVGELLASASNDHTVRLWNLHKPEWHKAIHVSTERLWSVSLSPSEKTFVTGSEDSSLRIWDTETSECLMILRGYCNRVWALAFGSTSAMLVAGSEDRSVRVWNSFTGEMALDLRGHASRIWAVAYSFDERWIASASDDRTVRIWNPRVGVCEHVLWGHEDWIRAVAFRADSLVLASAGEDGKIFLWNVRDGRRIAMIEGGMKGLFAITFCGEIIVAGGSGYDIGLWSSHDGQLIGILSGHNGNISSVSSSRDGERIVSGSEDGTIKLWRLQSRECEVTIDVGSKVWAANFCHDERRIVSGSEDGVVRFWNVEGGEYRSFSAHQGPVWSLAVGADNETVASGGGDGTIRVWNLSKPETPAAPMILRPPRPYEGMNITGATGLSTAQREALRTLGAIVDV